MMITRRAVILLSVLALAGCARAEGSTLNEVTPIDTQTATEDISTEDEPPVETIPADVDPDSIEPIISYVDSLNIALTGDLFALKDSALPGCGCLEIADRLAEIFPEQTLIGGHYQIKYIHLLIDQPTSKEFDVLVHRSDIEKIDKQSHKSVIWSESDIKTIFIVKQVGGVWELSDTR
ncbi:MAG: hypothetical protein F2670_03030 [Actinobacteria bacterium]|uniref:Unannotated protein n=1 Tax=freshwater metagenome TaxID=449393 RepID=A0A6J6PLR1_9ZZZZ|nr:hypothetical protein [Actinomycetota bacterium]MSY65196.1 hypothetical protein [Actinomycetota bacterium]